MIVKDFLNRFLLFLLFLLMAVHPVLANTSFYLSFETSPIKVNQPFCLPLIVDAVNTANNQTLTYDALDRLKSAVGAYGTVGGITYDSNSNRLTYGSSTYTISGTSNRITVGPSLSPITYTATGNIATYGAGATMTYNKANQLATAVLGTNSHAYTYDAFGQQITNKIGTATASVYQYDLSGNRLAESNVGTESDYVWLDGAPIASIQPAAAVINMVHTDRLGTVQKLTDSTKAIVRTITYTPNGQDTSTGTAPISLRLPGQTHDDYLYNHNGARDYFYAMGRYGEADPIGLAGAIIGSGGGVNLYPYAGNNAYSNVDPDGLSPLDVGCIEGPNPACLTGLATDALSIYRAYQTTQVLNVLANEKNDQQAKTKGAQCIVADVHGNSNQSQRQTEVYYLINRGSGKIDKIGITSDPQGRYSQAYLDIENVDYETQTQYYSRYPAKVDENIRLVHYLLQNGQLPRLNRTTY